MSVNISAISEAVAAILKISEGRDVEPWRVAAQAAGVLCAVYGVKPDDVLPIISETIGVAEGMGKEQ